MAYEVFDRNRGRMFVSCRKGAALVFSAGCKSFFEGIRQVELYIDREAGMAAVMGCAAGSRRRVLASNQFIVSYAAFMHELGLTDQKRIPVILKDGMLQFSYKQ